MTTLYNIKAQNAIPSIQDNVSTQDGVQYVVFVNGDRNPQIGKRTLPSGDWSYFDLSTVAGNPLAAPTVDDLHNSYSLAIDSDGYIHVSGNHHDNALRYVRSTNPGDITGWEAPGMVGTEENSVTYPQFLRLGPTLLFFYRNGSSGNGAVYINVYDTATQTWSRRSKPLSGLAADGVSPDESPYLNHISAGTDGTIHLFVLWRETSVVDTSHDICHIQSADGGTTWTDVDGGALALPVTPATAPVIKSGWNYAINTSGACVDSLGRPHSTWWLREAHDNYTPRLVHFWHDGTTWHEDTEHKFASGAVETIDLARPACFAYGDRVFVVYSLENDGHRTRWWLHDISPSPTARIPRMVMLTRDLGIYEPTYDTRAIADRGELHMLVTPIQPELTGADPAYVAQSGSVFTVDLSAVT